MSSLVFVPVLLLAQVANGSDNAVSTEPQKIESLLRHIESLNNAKFIRNGVEYDAQTAAHFMKAKWKAQETEIKSARDFIDKIATKSSTTGKPYLIRHADGREVESAVYLTTELKKLES